MNYQKIYNSLIERGKTRKLEGYTEKHHIIPRCEGGIDDKDNLVDLTPEEHYLAHQLLVKIYPNNPKLVKAAAMMVNNRPSNKMYGWLRRRFSIVKSNEQSGIGNSQFGSKWITNGIEEKKINKDEIVPESWFNQRLSSYLIQIEKEKEKVLNREKKQKSLNSKIEQLRKLHEVYIIKGFDGVREFGYSYSKPNLVSAFAKYLPEFMPQNGKSRKV